MHDWLSAIRFVPNWIHSHSTIIDETIVTMGKDNKKKDNKQQFVPKYRYLAKDRLAPYADASGSAIYTGKDADEKKFFKKGGIFSKMFGSKK